jgi:hypothetical protein
MKRTIKPKKKTQSIREWVAFRLVDLASWVYPNNEAGLAFMCDIIMESELEATKYGKSDIEIKVKKHKITPKEN